MVKSVAAGMAAGPGKVAESCTLVHRQKQRNAERDVNFWKLVSLPPVINYSNKATPPNLFQIVLFPSMQIYKPTGAILIQTTIALRND